MDMLHGPLAGKIVSFALPMAAALNAVAPESALVSGWKKSEARIANAPMTTCPANMLQKSRTASVTKRRNVEKSSISQTRTLSGKATPSGARLLM